MEARSVVGRISEEYTKSKNKGSFLNEVSVWLARERARISLREKANVYREGIIENVIGPGTIT
jgi:hypothetical protein